MITWNELSFSEESYNSLRKRSHNFSAKMPFGLQSATYAVNKYLITIAMTITTFVEGTFKGLTQLFGSIFHKEFTMDNAIEVLASTYLMVTLGVLNTVGFFISIPFGFYEGYKKVQ